MQKQYITQQINLPSEADGIVIVSDSAINQRRGQPTQQPNQVTQ